MLNINNCENSILLNRLIAIFNTCTRKNFIKKSELAKYRIYR